MINILIIGGAGHVGASLANKLLEKDTVSIVILDNLSAGKNKIYYFVKTLNLLLLSKRVI